MYKTFINPRGFSPSLAFMCPKIFLRGNRKASTPPRKILSMSLISASVACESLQKDYWSPIPYLAHTSILVDIIEKNKSRIVPWKKQKKNKIMQTRCYLYCHCLDWQKLIYRQIIQLLFCHWDFLLWNHEEKLNNK